MTKSKTLGHFIFGWHQRFIPKFKTELPV